jgi:competence protein ComEC
MPVIHFLNVRQGDCCIIEHGSGRVTMIDVNNARVLRPVDETLEKISKSIRKLNAATRTSGNYGQAEHPENPIAYMKRLSIASIFRFVLTHPDMDHMDGLADIFLTFSPPNFWDTANTCEKNDGWEGSPYRSEDWDYYRSIRDGAKRDVTRLTNYSGGPQRDFWRQDGLTVLAPTPDLVLNANASEDFNDCSYVVEYRVDNGFTAVFGGDSHDGTWNHIASAHPNLKDISLLVAPHHGRKSDRDYSFLDALKPKMTLFGNAPSEHLAYGAWTTRGLPYITNNQAGSVIVDAGQSPAPVYVTNKTFAASVAGSEPTYDERFDAYLVCAI